MAISYQRKLGDGTIVIDSNTSNVGIGTNDPEEKLHVVGDMTVNNGNNFTTINIESEKQTGNLGGIDWRYRYSTNDFVTARILADANGNWKIFSGGGDGVAPTTAVTVNTSQNVGIGTTSPDTRLHINVASTADYVINANDRLKVKGDGTLWWGSAADYGKLTWDTGKAVVRGESGKALSLGANGSQDTIYINTSQNVGIGTTSPSAKLHVVGDVILGEHRIIDLPSFNMGASSVTDEYLVVCKQAPSGGGVNASGIQGRISFSRGSSGSFNNSQYIDINIQMSLDSGSVNNLDVTQFELYKDDTLSIFSQLEEIDIDGTKYVALKARSSGGGDTNHFYFEGSISDASDTNILSRVRASDSTVTVTDPQPTGFPITPYITKNQDGNVGIGTTDPSANLEVAGAVKVTDSASGVTIGGVGHASLRLNRASTSYDNNILFNTNNDTKFRIWQDGNADYLYIRDDDNATNMVTFKKGGNVGIGTTGPSTKLHVEIPTSNDGSRQEIQRWVNTGQNSVSLFAYGGSTDLIQIGAWNAEQNIAIVTEALTSISATTAKGIYIKSGGNVGIGTTNPTSPLHIVSDGNRTITLDFTITSGGYSWASFKQNSSEQFRIWGSTSENYLSFYNDQQSSHQLTLASGGNVGIGTTSPDHKLTVYTDATSGVELVGQDGGNQNSDSSKIIFNGHAQDNGPFIQAINTSAYGIKRLGFFANRTATDYTTLPTESMSITNTGNVGIGKTDPSAPLHINGGSTNQVVKIQSTSAPYIRFKEGGTDVGFIQFGTDTYISNQKDGTLNFRTNNTDKMTILSNGNVGIGTTNPTRDLHIVKSNDGGQVRFQIINTSNTADSTSVISIYNGGADGGDPFLHWKIDAQQDWSMGIDNSDADKLKISKNFGPGTNDYLTVDTSGNVGIGTTSPSTKLDVDGYARFAKHYREGGFSALGSTVDDWYTIADFSLDSATYTYENFKGTVNWGYGGATSWYAVEFDVYFRGNNTIAADGAYVRWSYKQTGNAEGKGGSAIRIVRSDDVTYEIQISPITNYGVVNWEVLSPKYSSAVSLTTYDTVQTASTALSSSNIVQDSNFYVNGNVGIGTTSASSKLEVRKSTATHQLVSLNRPDSDVAAMYLGNDSSSPANGVIASNYSDLILGRDQSGTLTEHVRIKRDGNVGIGTDDPAEKLDVNGNIVASGSFFVAAEYDNDHLMRLEGNSSGGVLKGRDGGVDTVMIRSYGESHFNGGNVGIGTTHPDKKLDIRLADTSSGTYYAQTVGGSNHLTGYAVGIGFDPEGYGNRNKVGIIVEGTGNGWSTGHMHFVSKSDTGTGSDDEATIANARMTITSGGNVGIGNTDPDYKLDVYGSARIGGSNGDVDLVIEADADNSGENDNPRILLKQDGGLVQGMIGMNGDANFQLTGFASNSMYIRNTGYPVHIAAGTTLGLTVKTDGNIAFPAYGAGFLQTDANGNITAGSVTTSDTLDDVTDNGNSTTNSITVGGVTSTGGGEIQGGDLYFKNGGDDGAGTHIANVWYSVSTGGGAAPVGVYESAVITTVQNGTHGRSDLVFKTKNNDTANFGSTAERMRITKAGLIGINETNPLYGRLQVTQSVNNDEAGIGVLSASAGRSVRLWVDETVSYLSSGDNGAGILSLNPGGGNVGIGEINPASLLHLGKDTNGSNIISFGEASIGGPHGLDFYGDDATRTLKYSIYYRTGTENISMETSNGTKRFEINQSGAVTFNEAFTFPTADGSAGAALVTNGSGALSWGGGYQQYTPVGWGILNNQTYTSTGSNISSNSVQAQAGTTPVQRNSATEFEATKAGWYEISYSFIVKNNYTNRAMIGAYMTASTSGGGGVISGSHSTQYVRYNTYGEYAQIQNTFYYYTSASSTNFYLLAYLLSGSMNMTTQAVSQSMISFRYINNDIT